MNEVLIRKMKDEDWEEVQAIYKQGIDSGTATFMKNVPDFEYWDKAKLKIGRLVAEYNGKIVGWVTLSATSAREDYAGVNEVSIYVHENYKSLGIGKKLLQKVIEVSEQNNIWTLQSVILANNFSSRKLHESCGFRLVGYRERIAKDKHGNWQDSILMERRSEVVH